MGQNGLKRESQKRPGSGAGRLLLVRDKAAIKREESDARISFSERKQARPKVKGVDRRSTLNLMNYEL